MNSKSKGKRGELELAHALSSYVFTALGSSNRKAKKGRKKQWQKIQKP